MTGGLVTLQDQSVFSRKVDLSVSQVNVNTSETTTSASFTDLSTVGPAVTLSPGVTQDHLILHMAQGNNNTANQGWAHSPSIAGAAAATVDRILGTGAANANAIATGVVLATAQASGATHTLKYLAPANTAGFVNRRIFGIAI